MMPLQKKAAAVMAASPVQDLLLVLLIPVKAEEAQGSIPEGTRLDRPGAKAGPQLLQLGITLRDDLLQLGPQGLRQLLAHIHPHLHSSGKAPASVSTAAMASLAPKTEQ